METAKPAIASIKKKRPEIRQITTGDIKAALRAGFADLRAASIYSLFFGLHNQCFIDIYQALLKRYPYTCSWSRCDVLFNSG